MSAQVKKYDRDGNMEMYPVKVGDWVGFKSDYEQSGQIVAINGDELTLENEHGFGGDYLRYQTTTVEPADRCWID